MGELNVDDMKLFLNDPQTARRRHHQDWEEALAATQEQLFEGMQSVLSPVDAQALTGELAQWMYSSAQDALAAGDQGWWDDGASHLMNWGFELSEIRVPVKIWHGHQDRMVPIQHGQWLAANSPARKLRSANATAT
jgi:pimeloyl-ACP methyl ester carboxylesterase